MKDTAKSLTIVNVIDVYQRAARVNRADYDRGRVQLRLYTKRHTPYEYSRGIRESISIHRDNIAVLDGQILRPFV